MKIQKILFVTDFEELWFDALQSLMVLKKHGLNHVVFAHIIDRDNVANVRGVGYLKDEEVKLREMANIRFIDWAESLFEEGIEVGAHIVVGKRIPKIISIAEDEGVDLIVTGYHKKGGLFDLAGDNYIMEIVRRSSIPVLVHKFMPEKGRVNDRPFDTPLLVTDWTPVLDRAIDYLTGLKGVLQKVIVIHVSSEKELEGTSSMDVQKVRKEYRNKLEQICDRFKKEGIDSEQHLYVGDTVRQIEKAIGERKATMIVTAITTRESWKEKFLGSVPSELLKESMVPTLFITPS